MRSARPHLLLLLAAFSVGGLTLQAASPPPSAPASPAAIQPPSALPNLLNALHAASYAQREQATMALMRFPADRRPEIEEALARATDAEEISRLKRVAVHLYMKAQTSLTGEVGLLGISLLLEPVDFDRQGHGAQMAVLVTKVQPGFPAAEVLEPCDRVVAVNNETLPADSDTMAFRQYVKNTAPGHSLRLTIIREGRVMNVDVQVAGLLLRDAPLLGNIVEQRDQVAEEYLSRLKTGAGPVVLVLRDGGPPSPHFDVLSPVLPGGEP